MRWEEELIQICYQCLRQGGGEVHIQFSKRVKDGKAKFVPIIKFYAENQKILEEISFIE